MDLESNYEIATTADFIHSRSFTRVALQFPDNLLKDATKIVRALRAKLLSLKDYGEEQNGGSKDVGLFIMADTTYGNCCVDEVGASHINADCVIHYGHTCLSPTSTLPAFFVFGKASINVPNCIENLSKCASKNAKPILVLYGLEYAHAIPHIREAWKEANVAGSKLEINYANVMCNVRSPAENHKSMYELAGGFADDMSDAVAGRKYAIGGLIWNIPEGHKMEDYLLFWIGSDNSAFANVILTFNSCEIVRYDATEECMVTDVSHQLRILKRRYYLVEKAKDANIIGVLVGTLCVAGYLHMINQMKELITKAGKKAYTLAMGRPNPAKLANFPECDVFINVSCSQTALLDSKEFFAPVITPFEAMLAFSRGGQWTGAYVMEFRDLISSLPVEVKDQAEEARFSFLKGGYVEDTNQQDLVDDEQDKDGSLALATATVKALQLRDGNLNPLVKGTAKTGAEFFIGRSYHGLEIHGNGSSPEPYIVGRSGKASGYEDEISKQES